MDSGFYNNLDLKYPEMGILLEDSTYTLGEKKPKAKICIPILFPDVYNNFKVLEELVTTGKNNIMNSNYISLYIPTYLYNGDTVKSLPKGTKVIVVFIGGNISVDMIKVIGKYDDEEMN